MRQSQEYRGRHLQTSNPLSVQFNKQTVKYTYPTFNQGKLLTVNVSNKMGSIFNT